jgi:DNA-binding transcriptional regulator GbsR (MarR family)
LKDDAVQEAAPSRRLEAELEVAETVGRLMHFWGFKRPMGRTWTVLYLSPSPLSAADLADRLSMSAGGISMTLSALETWGCVERIWVPGERREYFRAEPDIWKMVQRVLARRELALVHEFGEALGRARDAMGGDAGSAGRAEGDPDAFKLDRLQRLAHLAGVGETLLQALVAGNTVDPTFLAYPSGRPDADAGRMARGKPAS